MITKKEIEVQIALGTVDTPQQIARLIKKTSDISALEWAIKYRNTKVRVAAINNKTLPIGLLLGACVFETSKIAQEALAKIVRIRRREISSVLNMIKYYPQLSIDLE